MSTIHPWRVLPPPWREGASGPVIQKYASSEFVETFRLAPDKALAWKDVDFVQEVVAGGGLSGKAFRRADPEVRKIFQPMHQRFYLVACRAVCEVPGRPPIRRDAVAEARLVVRRHRRIVRLDADEALVAQISALNAELSDVAQKLAQLTPPTQSGFIPWKAIRPMALRRTQLEARRDRLQARRQAIAATGSMVTSVEGWRPHPDHPEFGRWLPVADEPATLDEASWPLFPLVPDPRAADHPALGHAVWFGVVPALAAETTVDGQARFDPRHEYAIRCVLRQREPACPRGSRGGPLFWSAPSAVYRIAAPFDPHGVAQRPVTIEMPDLDDLAAAAAEGCQGSVRMVTPPGSVRTFTFDFELGSGSNLTPSGIAGSLPALEFMSIPLITIVAKFVLQLFMPIVMFVLSLYWMLQFAFSIPGSLMNGVVGTAKAHADAGDDAAIDAATCTGAHPPPDLTADLEFES